MGLFGSGSEAGLSFDNVAASPHPMQIHYLSASLRNKSQPEGGAFPSEAVLAALYA